MSRTASGAKSRDAEFQWGRDAEGNATIMPAIVAEYLEWLVSFPRDPLTEQEWAAAHDLSARTTRRWKADKRFIKEWEAKSHEMNIGPDRVQSVINNLYDIASNNKGPAGVKAADLFLQMVDKFTPKKQLVVTEDGDFSKLTSEDLMKIAQLTGDFEQ